MNPLTLPKTGKPMSPGAEILSALLDELGSARPEILRDLVAKERFHREDLLELMLHLARTEQLSLPDLSDRFVRFAILIATHYREAPDYARSVLARAHCLSANRFRLRRLLDQAEESLRTAATFLDVFPRRQETDRALYCRAVALVRWDQGLLDEAQSLLEHASFLLAGFDGLPERTMVSLLLALLYDEMGCGEGASSAASRLFCSSSDDPACPPWLKARVWLIFAAATFRNRQIALPALNEGLRFLGSVSDPLEQLRLLALEGRARGCLGFFDEAEQILEAVRRQHLAERRIPDLTAASLDLLALRCAANRPPEIDELGRDIDRLAAHNPIAVEHASTALDRFVSSVAEEEDPWIAARKAATSYRQILSFAGIRPAPLAIV